MLCKPVEHNATRLNIITTSLLALESSPYAFPFEWVCPMKVLDAGLERMPSNTKTPLLACQFYDKPAEV